MGFFNGLILSLVGMLAMFLLYKTIKNQPELFSKENLNKSFTSMGLLALILIGLVGFVVVLLKR